MAALHDVDDDLATMEIMVCYLDGLHSAPLCQRKKRGSLEAIGAPPLSKPCGGVKEKKYGGSLESSGMSSTD